jgi:hypothetical protein
MFKQMFSSVIPLCTMKVTVICLYTHAYNKMMDLGICQHAQTICTASEFFYNEWTWNTFWEMKEQKNYSSWRVNMEEFCLNCDFRHTVKY